MTARLAVFASGSGSNLQALLDHFPPGSGAAVSLVVSDRAGSGALARARAMAVPAAHVPVTGRDARDVASETIALLSDHGIEFIALAGYLRLVPAAVVAAYRERIVNIHPALLPAFGGTGMYGRRVHEAVLAARCAVTGATVHFVDDRYDEGRIIAQWPVPVLPGDSADVLGARVLRVEHRLYPEAVAALLRRSAAAAGSDAVDNRTAASGAVRPPGDSFRLGVSLDGIENEIIALANL